MASKFIYHKGDYKLNPKWLAEQPTIKERIKEKPPWELKHFDEHRGVKHYLGGYFNEVGNWCEPIVTVEKMYKDKWFQVEQYGEEFLGKG